MYLKCIFESFFEVCVQIVYCYDYVILSSAKFYAKVNNL